MNSLIVLSMLLTGAPGTRAPAPHALPYCPPASADADSLAYGLATSADYTDVRASFYMQATTAANVRVLADPADAAACQRMQSFAAQQAQTHGGTLTGTTTIFYKAGIYFFAIVTIPPPATTAPAGAVQIRDRMTLVYVFDANLNPILALAL